MSIRYQKLQFQKLLQCVQAGIIIYIIRTHFESFLAHLRQLKFETSPYLFSVCKTKQLKSHLKRGLCFESFNCLKKQYLLFCDLSILLCLSHTPALLGMAFLHWNNRYKIMLNIFIKRLMTSNKLTCYFSNLMIKITNSNYFTSYFINLC